VTLMEEEVPALREYLTADSFCTKKYISFFRGIGNGWQMGW
jgi:hypothetical protein